PSAGVPSSARETLARSSCPRCVRAANQSGLQWQGLTTISRAARRSVAFLGVGADRQRVVTCGSTAHHSGLWRPEAFLLSPSEVHSALPQAYNYLRGRPPADSGRCAEVATNNELAARHRAITLRLLGRPVKAIRDAVGRRSEVWFEWHSDNLSPYIVESCGAE